VTEGPDVSRRPLVQPLRFAATSAAHSIVSSYRRFENLARAEVGRPGRSVWHGLLVGV